jgi:hypothetical protein
MIQPFKVRPQGAVNAQSPAGILAGVLLLVALLVLVWGVVYLRADRTVNYIAVGEAFGKPYHTELFDEDCMPMGPETRRAFAMVEIGVQQRFLHFWAIRLLPCATLD